MIPASALYFFTRYATAGVGITSKQTTSTPIEQIPAISAPSNISHEILVSFPIKILAFFDLPSTKMFATALPIFSATSAVNSTFAIPLTPSVPKNFPIINSNSP